MATQPVSPQKSDATLTTVLDDISEEYKKEYLSLLNEFDKAVANFAASKKQNA